MHYTYKPTGICPTCIEFDIEDNRVYNVCYQNGCNGNLKAIGRLVEGMEAQELIRMLRGVECGYKKTSCSDQLAAAVAAAIAERSE